MTYIGIADHFVHCKHKYLRREHSLFYEKYEYGKLRTVNNDIHQHENPLIPTSKDLKVET